MWNIEVMVGTLAHIIMSKHEKKLYHIQNVFDVHLLKVYSLIHMEFMPNILANRLDAIDTFGYAQLLLLLLFEILFIFLELFHSFSLI